MKRVFIAILVSLVIGLPSEASLLGDYNSSFINRKEEVKTSFQLHGLVFGTLWIPISVAGLGIDLVEDTWNVVSEKL